MTTEFSPYFLNREIRRVPADWVHPNGPNDYSVGDVNGPKELYFLPFELQRPLSPGVAEDECMPKWSREEATHVQLYINTYAGIPVSPVFPSEVELACWLVANPPKAENAIGKLPYPNGDEWVAFLREALREGDAVLWPDPVVRAKHAKGLTFLSKDAETTRVFVNGAEIGAITYDALGWCGMDTARQLLASMAEELGVPVCDVD